MNLIGTLFLGAALKTANPWPWIGIYLGAFLLLALPLAVVFRLRTRFPERTATVLGARPWTCRLLGAANVLLVVLVGGAAAGHRVLGGIAALMLLLLLLLLLGGWAGVAESFGRGLSRRREDDTGIGGFTLGWLVTAGMPLFPILGPLVFLWFAAGAIGSAILTVAGKDR